MNHRIKDRVAHFWSYVQKSSPNKCWLWKGGLTDRRYGVFWDGKRLIRAHRFSYEIHNKKKVDPILVVMHSCDNPKCVNPRHLSVGTHGDNMQDAIKKHRMACGEDFWCAKTNNKTVLAIRADFKQPFSLKQECERLAKKFGINRKMVYQIVSGKTWKHLL